MLTTSGGKYYRNKNLFITEYYGVYYGILRILRTFITDITVLFLRNLLALEQGPQKRPENPLNMGKIGKNQVDL